ncbi:hypothetical protein [Cloacibacterium sp.]|uniref:hypothetical protein n=1 Tax=Cloacibacterium sp. TaxID=1913682 RepID=UPI0039E393BF
MKTKYILFFGFWLALFAISCNRDDFNFEVPTQKLSFSEDTLVLDTVYNQVRSETYAVKIYNKEDKDISIPRIYLEGGAASQYRINVDGKQGTEFTNVPLRKKDSLYVFVEIAPNSNATEAIAEDRIQVESPVASQHVTLLSVVQDVEFYVSTSSNPQIINQNTVWSSNKAKIIYGDLKVAEGKSLTLSEGTKVYFHRDANLKIGKNAQLIANGDLGKEVIFRGDRNDARYDTLPKNWGGIQLEQGAIANLNYSKIFGGTNALYLDQASATLKNTIIHTNQEFGILGINATVNAENLVMNNCGQACIGIFKGGNYNILHSTIANYWDLNGALPGFGIYATNEYVNGTTTELGALNLNLKNSIVYSDKSTAIQFKPISGQTFTYFIENSLLKYETQNAGFNFDGNTSVVNSIQNQDPKFENYFIQKLNLRLKADSPAKGKAKVSTAALVPLDIVKVNRTITPTIGAYQ